MISNRKLTFTFVLLLMGVFIIQCEFKLEEKPFILGKGYGVYSTSLLVNDLDSVTKYYADTLGFTSSRGVEDGDYEGTSTSTISFADLTSLEFLALKDSIDLDSIPPFLSSFLPDINGVRIFALSSSSADSTSEWLVSRGFQMDSLQSNRTSALAEGWSWDDGGPEYRSLDFNRQNPPRHLPRFIEEADYNYVQSDQQWRSYYSYGRRYNEHPNGVVGIKAIRIAVNDLEAVANDYKKMGFKASVSNDTAVHYPLYRNQQLHLISPKRNAAISEFLNQRGDGVYAIQFDVSNLDSTYSYLKKKLPPQALFSTSDLVGVLPEYAFGVQLEFVEEAEEQAVMAKMLRPDDKLDSVAIQHASAMYAKYCSLCHGAEREGYAADNAPSLRSKSLLSSSMNTNFLRYTIQYGRANTAMAGYIDTQGGPLEYIDIEILLQWLYETAEVDEPLKLSREPVLGDLGLGASIYAKNCAVCHGENGEGVSAPALGNPMLLATATDHFLRHAIAEGRDGTPMIAFKDSLSAEEIDGVTAFLRSKAAGWEIPKGDTVTIPSPENYVLNEDNQAPVFDLRDGKYVSAVQVNQALQDGNRMVILDARSEVAWRQMHIPGSIPVPYYEEPENFINDIPNDSTQIVIYCACPHAASLRVMYTLRRHGFENTAIIDEGILVWAQMGFPVQNGS